MQDTWRARILIALVLWIVFTAVLIPLAPRLGRLPVAVTGTLVVIACYGVGVVLQRVYVRRTGTSDSAAGLRLGATIVVIGQLLDLVLVLGFDGRYPGTTEATNAPILLLLLGGYAGVLAGTDSGSDFAWLAGKRRVPRS